jgi:hypothetical protein
MRTKGAGGSQFWKGVQKVKNKIRWGDVNQVNNGEQTLFWEDTWNGQVSLELVFPKLYDCCRDKNSTVREYYGGIGSLISGGPLVLGK